MSIFPTCKHEWTDPINSNCPQCETEEEIATLRARIAELEREHEEDQGVIRVWRGRTERAESRIAELEAVARDYGWSPGDSLVKFMRHLCEDAMPGRAAELARQKRK